MVLVDYLISWEGSYSVRGQEIGSYTGIHYVTLLGVIVSPAGGWSLLSLVACFHCNFILANSLGPRRETLAAAFGTS